MLAFESKKVYKALTDKTIKEARKQVSMIVGRQTNTLNAKEITAATIETVAENTSDGFIGPLLYTVLFGVYGGIIYKAFNTLDSMVGYPYSPYTYYGRFSAKADDIVNYLPARLTWALILIVTLLPQFNHKNAWRIASRDARAHKSPNAGYPESVVAGALEIQLGGSHFYHNMEVYNPTIGDPIRPIQPFDIILTNKILFYTAGLAMVIAILILGVIL